MKTTRPDTWKLPGLNRWKLPDLDTWKQTTRPDTWKLPDLNTWKLPGLTLETTRFGYQETHRIRHETWNEEAWAALNY
jgi:hypothetical protein